MLNIILACNEQAKRQGHDFVLFAVTLLNFSVPHRSFQGTANPHRTESSTKSTCSSRIVPGTQSPFNRPPRRFETARSAKQCDQITSLNRLRRVSKRSFLHHHVQSNLGCQQLHDVRFTLARCGKDSPSYRLTSLGSGPCSSLRIPRRV